MIRIAASRADAIEGGIHFRRTQFGVVRADQQAAGKSASHQFVHSGIVFVEDFDAFAEAGAARVSSRQTERHIRAQRGGDLPQPFDGPMEVPQRVERQQCRGRIGGTARHAGADGNALFDA